MKPLIALIALFLCGCHTAQQGVNDCLPAAITAREIMAKQGVAAKVLVVHWKDGDKPNDKIRGHAYAVFRYGRNFAYDKDFGSIALSPATDTSVAYDVAFEANMQRGLYGAVTKAEYLE
jgi:hypothetical protein